MAMVFCRGCAKEIHESAPTCPTCGAPQNPASNGGGPQALASGGKKNDFIAWGIQPFKKYADFKGRARRKEYWYFFLMVMLIAFVVGISDAILKTSALSNLFSLAVLVPSIAVGVRRLHDTDRSGWWVVVPIVGLVFSFFEGQKAPNRFGPDPKMTGIA